MTLFYALYICLLKAHLSTDINGVELFEDKILSNIVTSYPDASLFLAGDFNSRTSNLTADKHVIWNG